MPHEPLELNILNFPSKYLSQRRETDIASLIIYFIALGLIIQTKSMLVKYGKILKLNNHFNLEFSTIIQITFE